MKSLDARGTTVISGDAGKHHSGGLGTPFLQQLLAGLTAVIANCGVTIDEIDTDRRTWKKARVPKAVARVWRRASPLRVAQIGEPVAPAHLSSHRETRRRVLRGRIAIFLPGRGACYASHIRPPWEFVRARTYNLKVSFGLRRRRAHRRRLPFRTREETDQAGTSCFTAVTLGPFNTTRN